MRSIANAIRIYAPRYFQAQTTYQQNVVNVTTLMTSVYSTQLPVLNNYPSNWADFVSTNSDALQAAQNWATNVLVQLLDVPDDVAANNTNITDTLNDAAGYATTLAQGGYNSVTANALLTDLGVVQKQLNLVSTYIASCESAIQSFQTNDLVTLGGDLQTLTTDFANVVGADTTAIQTLTDDISDLRSDIGTQAEAIIFAGAIITATIYIARLTPGWTPLSIVNKLLMAAIAAGAAYSIDLAADNIAADLAKIKNDQQQVTNYNEDVTACQLQANLYTSLGGQVNALGPTLTAILQEWQTLEGEVGDAINDVKAALNETSPTTDFTTVSTDIQNALNEWSAATAQASSLKLPISFNTAMLSPGMTVEQAQQAVAAGTNTDMVTFLSSPPTAFAT
jgi:hypothetical protein